MSEKKATNITWHEGELNKKNREELLGQKGVILWFTGLSGSGKSTLARAVEAKLYEYGALSYVLDGDNIRHGLNSDLGFSARDRTENIRRIGEVARLFADAGIITLAAFISPYRKDRKRIRKLVGEEEFIEIYVKVSLEEAQKRDPKGLYKKARKGKIEDFTGISAPYEEPKDPKMVVDTNKEEIEDSKNRIITYLKDNNIISKNS
ncbi:MAG: adenylyl-sulfate kinase [Elusimicrobiota bacterium]